MNLNLLNILAILIGLSAISKWFLIWRKVHQHQGNPSPVLAFVEVAGYVLVVGLVIRVLGVM